MKKILSIIMLAGMLTGTVSAADVQSVASMAAASSGVSIDTLSVAVYEAVKANPESAVDVFRAVMGKRSSWSVTETYAILRSVLLASPSLESNFVQAATGGQASTLGQQLLAALSSMPQTSSVAATVVQGVVGSSVAGRAAGNGVSQSALEAYVPAAPSAPEYTVTPTPPPTSANN